MALDMLLVIVERKSGIGRLEPIWRTNSRSATSMQGPGEVVATSASVIRASAMSDREALVPCQSDSVSGERLHAQPLGQRPAPRAAMRRVSTKSVSRRASRSAEPDGRRCTARHPPTSLRQPASRTVPAPARADADGVDNGRPSGKCSINERNIWRLPTNKSVGALTETPRRRQSMCTGVITAQPALSPYTCRSGAASWHGS